MKIAVYSVNFGNYRNEVSIDKMNKIIFSKGIDYYFFTDSDIKCKWNIKKVTLEKELDFMDKYRHTTKKYKYCLPKILNSYDYVIWCDTKSLENIDNLSLNKIKKLITNKKKYIYLIKHPIRQNMIQELNATLKKRIGDKRGEKEYYVNKFKNKIQNIRFNSQLPDSTTFLRKVDTKYNKIFTEIYNIMLSNKLQRDQNIIQYAFYIMDCESKLFYFNSSQNFRKELQKISIFMFIYLTVIEVTMSYIIKLKKLKLI